MPYNVATDDDNEVLSPEKDVYHKNEYYNKQYNGEYQTPYRQPQHNQYPTIEQMYGQPLRFPTVDSDKGSSIRGRNASVFVAILVVLSFQFQGPWTRLYREIFRRWRNLESVEDIDYRNETFRDSLIGFLISVSVFFSDYIRIAWYTCAELARNILVALSSIISIVSIEDGDKIGYDQTSIRRDRRKILGKRIPYTMPELEDIGISRVLDSDGQVFNETNQSCWSSEQIMSIELEPAFIEEKDFPGDWMVYHPSLGVVKKSIADKKYNGQCTQTECITTSDQLDVLKENSFMVGDSFVSNSDNLDAVGTSSHNHRVNPVSKSLTIVKRVGTDAKAIPVPVIPNEQDQCPQFDQKSTLPLLRSVVAT